MKINFIVQSLRSITIRRFSFFSGFIKNIGDYCVENVEFNLFYIRFHCTSFVFILGGLVGI